MRHRFSTTTAALLDEREELVLILAEIGVGRFQDLGVTERHPTRVFNVGIREQLMVGVAAGIALESMIPIVHSYAPFVVERAFEQLKLGFGPQGLRVVVASTGGSYDDGSGRTHEAPEDVALINTLPNWEVFQPGHPDEVEHMLRAAMTMDSSIYLRFEATSNETAVTNPTGLTLVRSGKEQSPVVIAVGPMLDRVLAATRNIEARVFYTAAPSRLRHSIASIGGEEFIIVEPTLTGTSIPELSLGLTHRPVRLHAIGVDDPDRTVYGTLNERHAHFGLDEVGIRTRIKQWLELA